MAACRWSSRPSSSATPAPPASADELCLQLGECVSVLEVGARRCGDVRGTRAAARRCGRRCARHRCSGASARTGRQGVAAPRPIACRLLIRQQCRVLCLSLPLNLTAVPCAVPFVCVHFIAVAARCGNRHWSWCCGQALEKLETERGQFSVLIRRAGQAPHTRGELLDGCCFWRVPVLYRI